MNSLCLMLEYAKATTFYATKMGRAEEQLAAENIISKQKVIFTNLPSRNPCKVPHSNPEEFMFCVGNLLLLRVVAYRKLL